MTMSMDEDEHSIEMHLPYVAKIMEEWVGIDCYGTSTAMCIHVLHDSHDIQQLFPKVRSTNHSVSHSVFEMEETHRTHCSFCDAGAEFWMYCLDAPKRSKD
jgi:hypothetical protein